MSRLLILSRQGSASLPADLLAELREAADVRAVRLGAAPDRDTAAALLSDVDLLGSTNICLPTVDRELLDAAPSLRGIVLYATGYDHLDVNLLAGRDVGLSVVGDYATTAVAEHSLALLLCLATRAHLANDQCRGIAPRTASLRGIELAGKTLGVLGVGRIGTSVAALAAGLGMRVIGADPDPAAVTRARTAGITMVPAGELLAAADAISLCASHRLQARPLIGAAELARMRPGTLLVNASRSALVDVAAMVAAVRRGQLRGYAVDDRLADPGSFADLAAQGRILQTGHGAWWRDEAMQRGARLWGDRLLAAVRGAPLDVVTWPVAGVAVPA